MKISNEFYQRGLTIINFLRIFPTRSIKTDVTNTGNGERGTGNGERGTGNGERGTGNRERGTGNGSLGTSVQR